MNREDTAVLRDAPRCPVCVEISYFLFTTEFTACTECARHRPLLDVRLPFGIGMLRTQIAVRDLLGISFGITADHRFFTGIENGYERMNREETAAPRLFLVASRALLFRPSLFEPPLEPIVRLRGLLGKRNACRVKAPRSHVRCRALRSPDCSNSDSEPPRSQRSPRSRVSRLQSSGRDQQEGHPGIPGNAARILRKK